MIRFKQWAIFKHYLWEIKVSETDISNEKLCKYVKMIYIFKRTMKIVLLHYEYKNFTQKNIRRRIVLRKNKISVILIYLMPFI